MYIIVKAVDLFFSFISAMILVRVLISWLPGINRYANWVRFVDSFTDPIMEPIQRVTFKYINIGAIDISPMIALFAISFIRNIILRILFMIF